jgi:purine-nucleoside phosphorylase
MLGSIERSVAYIGNIINVRPQIAIVLGTGLGAFVNELEIIHEIPYSSIPCFPVSGIKGHKGSLLFAIIGKVPVVIMQGRVHYYEGFSMQEVTYPVRVLKYLGVHTLILTNAAGGLNPDLSIGDIMIINDHINMMPNPLIGEHIPEFGERFPDMSEPYDKKLIEKIKEIAVSEKINLLEGCYIGVTGPTYETPAEYRFYRLIGGDAIGMSTVPEVITGRQMGLRCSAFSVITDLGIPGKIEFLSHEMVQKAAADAEPALAVLIKRLIGELV